MEPCTGVCIHCLVPSIAAGAGEAKGHPIWELKLCREA